MEQEIFTGYEKIWPHDEDWIEWAKNGTMEQQTGALRENTYVIAYSDSELVEKFCYQNGKLRKLNYAPIINKFIGIIKPRNLQQYFAADLLADPTTKVKIIRGVYGSGKDFLMLNQALNLIDKGKFEKIVYIRPNITVKDLPDIGALPGTADEKLEWTLGPFYDKVGGKEGIDKLVSENKLEVVPLLYIRGRSFENSIIYVTEGQNMTTEIAKLILGRVGEGSELWINGDTHQSDKKIFEQDNGIGKMIEKLKGNPMFGYVYLPTTERSDVANLANLLD